jgi:hypothetical protein
MLFSVNTDTLLNDTNDKTHWIRFPWAKPNNSNLSQQKRRFLYNKKRLFVFAQVWLTRLI